MSDDQREHLGTCEGCSVEIRDGDEHCHTIDGCWLCKECSPMLSDVINCHEAEIDRWGEYEFDSREEMEANIATMKADLAANGDRSIAST